MVPWGKFGMDGGTKTIVIISRVVGFFVLG